MRLDKYLTESLGISRSEAKVLIKKGQVKVDGLPVKDPGLKVMPEKNLVTAGDKSCIYEKYHYYMLHKPAGVITAVSDTRDRTVMDLLPGLQKGLFPVGRLDKDTEGLLLITDDGALAHRLLSPKKHVNKCYLAEISGPISEEDKHSFATGLDIGEEKPTMPAVIKAVMEEEAEHGHYYVEITIQEGKFHQVKRMVKAIGKEVLYLKRLSMGSLRLDQTLAKGEFRPLTQEEIDILQE